MSVLFNHARRYDFIERNPITLVRQSAKGRTIPEVLLPSEINRLANSLRNREKTLVLLAAGTGPSYERTVRSKVARCRLRGKTG